MHLRVEALRSGDWKARLRFYAQSFGFLPSFILLLCLIFSMPISRTIYLFELEIKAGWAGLGADVIVQFGLWGFCGNGGEVK